MSPTITDQTIKIPPTGVSGDLVIPVRATGIVVFAGGSGSSRHSPPNRYLASVFQQGGLATLLLDLLTEAEEAVDAETRRLRFDVPLLAARLIEVTDWLRQEPATRGLELGYFGSGTGAAAALVASAERGSVVRAVVSCTGRPDLAGPALARVKAPTLLVVGEDDRAIVALNQASLEDLPAGKKLSIVSGASRGFEQPGKLEQASRMALKWFQRYLDFRDSAHTEA
jgi:putative phosphoribosyl transferase